MGRRRKYRTNASRQRAYRKRQKRFALLALRQKSVEVELPGVFRVLYADPPWDYSNNSISGAAENHYPTLPLETICNMKLPAMASNAVLFLWSPAPILEQALQVIHF